MTAEMFKRACFNFAGMLLVPCKQHTWDAKKIRPGSIEMKKKKKKM